MLSVGEGFEREQCHLFPSLLVFSHSLRYPQSNWVFWCCFPSRWACAHSRPLWVSPMNSLVRLGVSPAAALTPMGVFNQRFEALFPRAGDLGCEVCFAPPQFLLVYLQTNVGPPSPQSAASPGPPATTLCRVLSAQLPVSTPPTCLDECFFFISLVVRLPYSSIFCQFWLVLFSNYCCLSFGCARRHSVSTNTSVLARSANSSLNV